MRESKVTSYFTIFVLLLFLGMPIVSAECQQELVYSYTNNEPVLHRISFVLVEKSDRDLQVTFEPTPFEVRPGETRNFSVIGSSTESISNPSVLVQVRKNAIPVQEINASFNLCHEEERPTFSSDISMQRIFTVLGILFVVILGALFVLGMDSPRKLKYSERKETRTGIERTKIDVDSLIEGYEIKPQEDPKLSTVLVVLLIIFIVLVLGLILMLVLTQNPTPLSAMPTSSLP